MAGALEEEYQRLSAVIEESGRVARLDLERRVIELRGPTHSSHQSHTGKGAAPRRIWPRALHRLRMVKPTTVAETASWVRNAGLLMVLFVGYQLWGTHAAEARAQSQLRHHFSKAVAAGSVRQHLGGRRPAGGGGATAAATVARPAPGPPPPGEAVAIIRIPRIGVDQAVVEGTSVADLRKGPGHYRRSPLPGQHGNVAIAGHRTTYGAPFNRIDELKPGDPILLTTTKGAAIYEVTGQQVVTPSHREVLEDQHDDRLTLTTCNPKYFATQRLIVTARLRPNDQQTPAAAPVPSAAAAGRRRPPESLGLGWNTSAWLPTLFWFSLLVAAWRGTRRLRQHWLRRSSLLVALPPLSLLVLVFFESLNRLLPASA
ncbi:MAG: class E sortase [Acidimicrobiales bacterium]